MHARHARRNTPNSQVFKAYPTKIVAMLLAHDCTVREYRIVDSHRRLINYLFSIWFVQRWLARLKKSHRKLSTIWNDPNYDYKLDWPKVDLAHVDLTFYKRSGIVIYRWGSRSSIRLFWYQRGLRRHQGHLTATLRVHDPKAEAFFTLTATTALCNYLFRHP